MKKLPEYIEIKLDETKTVKSKDYVKAKTKDLIDYGYITLTEKTVSESLLKVLNKKPVTVIDFLIQKDIKI